MLLYLSNVRVDSMCLWLFEGSWVEYALHFIMGDYDRVMTGSGDFEGSAVK